MKRRANGSRVNRLRGHWNAFARFPFKSLEQGRARKCCENIEDNNAPLEHIHAPVCSSVLFEKVAR
jgi:hypothetical protein